MIESGKGLVHMLSCLFEDHRVHVLAHRLESNPCILMSEVYSSLQAVETTEKIAWLYRETLSYISLPDAEWKRVFQTSYTQPKSPRAHLDIIGKDLYIIILSQ